VTSQAIERISRECFSYQGEEWIVASETRQALQICRVSDIDLTTGQLPNKDGKLDAAKVKWVTAKSAELSEEIQRMHDISNEAFGYCPVCIAAEKNNPQECCKGCADNVGAFERIKGRAK